MFDDIFDFEDILPEKKPQKEKPDPKDPGKKNSKGWDSGLWSTKKDDKPNPADTCTRSTNGDSDEGC